MLDRKKQFEKINEIITKYHLYVDYLGSKNNLVLAMDDIDDRDEAITYVARVYHSYDSLSFEEKETITKEFFFQDDPNWWKQKYSEASFKLILFSGINNFLKRFDSYGI